MKIHVAVFAYNRSAHLHRALSSLERCVGCAEIPIHIFCDGAKSEADRASVEDTRTVARAWAEIHSASVHCSETNRGLAASILDGVTELFEIAEGVIVIEDDLVLHPSFLDFHRRCLEHYVGDERAMQISGFRFGSDVPDVTVSFASIVSTWGWSTWKRAWKGFRPIESWPEELDSEVTRRKFDLEGVYPYGKMLRDRLSGANDSWGIFWYWYVFSSGGLVAYPPVSLVENLGFDGSGVHCGGAAAFEKGRFQQAIPRDLGKWKWPHKVELSQAFYRDAIAWIDRVNRPAVTSSKSEKPNPSPKSIRFLMWKKSLSWLSNVLDKGAGELGSGGKRKPPKHLSPSNKPKKYTSGENTEVRGAVERRAKGAQITIGRDCLIEGMVVAEAPDSRVSIGNNVFIGGGTVLDCTLSITVEDDVLISYGGVIADSDNHDVRYSIRRHDLKAWREGGFSDWDRRPRSPVLVKKGAWIGAKAIILKGVTIGEGAIVGAGSVVTKNVPDWSVAAGNPARIIRHLAENER